MVVVSTTASVATASRLETSRRPSLTSSTTTGSLLVALLITIGESEADELAAGGVSAPRPIITIAAINATRTNCVKKINRHALGNPIG